MQLFDSTDRGVVNILKACGIDINKVKRVSDLVGLKFEFKYKHGIIAQSIHNAFITMTKDPSTENEHPQLEISLNMQQCRNFICLVCVVNNSLTIEEPNWVLMSNQGRDGKDYKGEFKLIY